MMMLRILGYPLAVLFNLVTAWRNMLYDRGFRPSVEFDIPVINVGNLTVGGTGKSPMIEHLVRLIGAHVRVATLSRGYGRETKGLRFAGENDNARTLGDEPFQFYKKFGQQVVVTVCEDRAFAIPHILQENPEVGVILMDDAFQHRRVRPLLNILLSDYYRPFYKDFLLPAGRLRESRGNAQRADIIIVTKCPPELSDEEAIEIEKLIRTYADRPVFFSSIRYGNPVMMEGSTETAIDGVVLVTGIGNARPLEEYVRQNYKMIDHVEFADHHHYSVRDLEKICTTAKRSTGGCVITTEKDMVKLTDPLFSSYLQDVPFFYIPIEVQFLKNGEDFDAIILNSIRSAR